MAENLTKRDEKDIKKNKQQKFKKVIVSFVFLLPSNARTEKLLEELAVKKCNYKSSVGKKRNVYPNHAFHLFDN